MANMEESLITPGVTLLHINPSDKLDFYLPEDRTQQSICELTLKNVTDGMVMYKVKTTAPKEYCVKPNSGQLEVGEEIKVQVMLQPPLPRPAQKKDKFQIQAAKVEGRLSSDALTERWKKLREEEMQQVKLKCQWHFGDGHEPEAPTRDAEAAGNEPTLAKPAPVVEELSPPPPRPTTQVQPPPPRPTNQVQPPPPRPTSSNTANPNNSLSASQTAATQGPVGTVRRAQVSGGSSSSSAAAATPVAASSSSGGSSSLSSGGVTNTAGVVPSKAAGQTLSAGLNANNESLALVLLVIAFFLGIIFGKVVL